jgi:hypothetical protein
MPSSAKPRDEPIGPGFDDNLGVCAGFVAAIAKIDSKGRIEVLGGMIRHELPAEMVVA